MKNMRLKLIFTVLMMLIGVYAQALEIKNISQAVNESGKERMLTQRMLKDYAMIGMHNTFDNPKEDLKNTISTFEENLKALINFTKDKATKDALNKEQKLWESIKKELLATPSKDKALKLQEKLEELLKSADETTKLLAKQTGKESGKIINIAGRQRMLSQKMAALYMLRVWGINDKEFQNKMKSTMKLFGDSLNTLMKSDLNTPEINKLLQSVKNDFIFFQIMSRSSTKFIPTLIYQKSNRILDNMNKVTELYAKQKVK